MLACNGAPVLCGIGAEGVRTFRFLRADSLDNSKVCQATLSIHSLLQILSRAARLHHSPAPSHAYLWQQFGPFRRFFSRGGFVECPESERMSGSEDAIWLLGHVTPAGVAEVFHRLNPHQTINTLRTYTDLSLQLSAGTWDPGLS